LFAAVLPLPAAPALELAVLLPVLDAAFRELVPELPQLASISTPLYVCVFTSPPGCEPVVVVCEPEVVVCDLVVL
jgi:hypothetical protein